MPYRSEFWFFFPLRVRYAEVDQQGIVFNAHYLTYFDVGITEYFRALGYDYTSQPARTGTDFHVVKSLVEYKAPVRFDEEIEVAVRTARLGRTSLTFGQTRYSERARRNCAPRVKLSTPTPIKRPIRRCLFPPGYRL
ncbi:MAG: thioesterase family protein [Rhodomicrobium sp.]